MLNVWYERLKGGGDLDRRTRPPYGADCDRGQCDNTLAICNKCLESSVPANIIFGYIGTFYLGAAGAMRYAAERGGPQVFFGLAGLGQEPSGPDIYCAREGTMRGLEFVRCWRWPSHDQAAVRLGTELQGRVTRDALCNAVLSKIGSLQQPRPECRGAPPCAWL